ncbi:MULTISPECIES: ion channel [unclassified Agarivorans]|uniref:ion channel n=1 Tax=unclassified Agarivorans TaxID=2636026 RepID=UPI0026E22879|nr:MULTISPECIES: ion channel [unclassified Agarivorans]MDO6687173.1 ion channel [Agarivorans sp. 3_MG-2023]MDO6716900.1 ion channel [Agarivorans sp. 2_MG-2023]
MAKCSECLYQDSSGANCTEPALSSGLCFWHDPDEDKSGDEIKEKLESYAKRGGMLRGISLKKANLAGIDLVNYNNKQGYDMTGVDLYRSNLRGAHLFNINLQHGSLMKADLRDANLNHANLTKTNLLGAKMDLCKCDSLCVGEKVLQEQLGSAAEKQQDKDAMADYYQQAEEVYRCLRKTAESEGLFTTAGIFLKKELTMRRYQMPKYSYKRAISKLVDLVCGYGEQPMRVVLTSLLIILSCAVVYFFTGIHFNGNVVSLDLSQSLGRNIVAFFECLYYSVVTFTTLGYGDFTPVGFSRIFAAIEAFSGSFIIALFVVVFVKKMTR